MVKLGDFGFANLDNTLYFFASHYWLSQWHGFRGIGQRKRLLLKKNDIIDFLNLGNKIGFIWYSVFWCGVIEKMVGIGFADLIKNVYYWKKGCYRFSRFNKKGWYRKKMFGIGFAVSKKSG